MNPYTVYGIHSYGEPIKRVPLNSKYIVKEKLCPIKNNFAALIEKNSYKKIRLSKSS